ncbi:lipid-A-disaccharide synthase-related protein [Lusitaniella coriacea]|uniref:lipid-A-disaccharide synthase-related protein n=1 Tax=Lusitaniella coriacea TaxID=1983105 RepID=UPI003CEC7CF7
MKVLCLSNGHGEDAIAVRILEALQQEAPTLELAALPIVGEGRAYEKLNIPIIGAVKQMPSGGFIYMESKQLWRDVRGGLLRLTWEQYKAIRCWVKSSKDGALVLAVGDLVPLLFAWLSGASYAFVGTAKSEYYLRDEQGWLSPKTRKEGWAGSVYYPWERWLMSRKRCKGVFPRDTLTSKVLQRWSIPVFDLGNPMMDGIQTVVTNCQETDEQEEIRALTFVLLPGSRVPEAYENWRQILQATPLLMQRFRGRSPLFLGAIAPTLDLDPLEKSLGEMGWKPQPRNPLTLPINDPNALVFTQDRATLVLTQSTYSDCLQAADFAIAMTGTATEQFVGLGKPAIALPGKGPQCTYAFVEAQSRHLGPSLILAPQPQNVASIVDSLLGDPDRLQLIAANGKQRMGQPGAARKIARCLLEVSGTC